MKATDRLLIFHPRAARRRARAAAAAEALALLRGLEPNLRPGGPLADQGGVLWISVPEVAIDEAARRLPRLGYCDAVDLLEPIEGHERGRVTPTAGEVVRWRGRDYLLTRLYEDDPAHLRDQAPDRRAFLLETPTGAVRRVVGYRGDGGQLSRRGLPVVDGRLLVNLVYAPAGGVFLDPFAGVGGVALEALAAGWRVVTADLEPALRFGLTAFGAAHVVADAGRLPIPDCGVQAVATEPPYDREAERAVLRGFREMIRALAGGGRLAMLVADWQREALLAEAARLELTAELDCPIDRKGLPVVALAWCKPPGPERLTTA